VWPDARYLVLVRDPRDVLCSWRCHATKSQVAQDFPELRDLAASVFARSWKAVYTGFKKELPNSMWMRYEDLCAEPRRQISAVLDFLELEWEPELDSVLGARDLFESHGTSRDLASTIGRWRRDLCDDDIREVVSHCADAMRGLGYDTNADRRSLRHGTPEAG
jgi:hypothetical protein